LGSKLVGELNGNGGVFTPVPDGFVRLWDARSGKELKRLVLPKQRTGGFAELAFGPGGNTLVTLDQDGLRQVPELCVWDVASAEQRRRIPVGCYLAFGLACSRDGRLLATTAGGLTIRLFDALSGKDLAPPGPHQLAVHVALPARGKAVIT